jgi:hypothetical protein
MPLLIIEKGKDKGKKIRLEKETSLEAGRGQNADLRLRDSMTSRSHFRIECGRNDWFITDCGSSNGTFVNNKRIDSRTRLELGDVILAGDILLSFSADPDAGETLAAPGTAIAGYIIEKRIGRGGMGTVYKALQVSLDRPVALKVLSKELVQDKNFINMFIREARAAGQLNHPNIVQVYDVGSHDGTYYFSMEYMGGGSIEEIVNRDGRLPVHMTLQYAIGSARGLEYAMKRGIVHRDIKPDNLMLTEENAVKIGDLGIARSMQKGRVSQKEGVSGSPHYMAPEQAQGLDIDTRADIYGLGVSVFQMLTGRTPYLGSSPREIILKQINEPAPSIRSINPDVPEDVCAAVKRMMAKDRSKRYQDPGELIEDLTVLQRKYPGEGVEIESPGLDLGKLALPGMIIGIAIVVAVVAFFLITGLMESSRRTAAARQTFLDRSGGITALVREFDKRRGGLKKLQEAKDEAERLYNEYNQRDDREDFADLLEKLWHQYETISKKLKVEQEKEIKREAVRRFDKLQKEIPKDITGAGDGELAEAKRKLEIFLAEEKYRELSQWTEAEIRLAEIKQELRIRSQFRADGAEAVNELIDNVRRYISAKRFKEAILECEAFPIRYKKLTSAWAKREEIEADLIKAVRDEISKRLKDVQGLVNRAKLGEALDEAKKLEDDYAGRVFDTFRLRIERKRREIEDVIKRRKEQEILVTRRADQSRFRNIYSKALDYMKAHDFNNARNQFTSERHWLKTDEFKKKTDAVAAAMGYLVSLKNRLCKELNGSLMGTEFTLGPYKGKVVSADKNFIRLIGVAGIEDLVRWGKLSSTDFGKLIVHITLSPEETLGRAVYLYEIGNKREANNYANRAIAKNRLLKKPWQGYLDARASR